MARILDDRQGSWMIGKDPESSKRLRKNKDASVPCIA